VEALLAGIIDYLNAVGPVVVYLVTLVETAFFVGLLVPAEATVLVAAFLAAEGVFTVESVLLATSLGALSGDQLGYALGRFGGTRFAARGGRIGRLWARYEPRAESMFRKRAVVAVTLARFVSFVRTLMPWFAGMTRMSWPRFFLFDLFGAFGWAAASVLAGYLAGESWTVLAGWLGRASAVIVFAIVITAGALLWRRRHRAMNATAAAASSPPADGMAQGRPASDVAGPRLPEPPDAPLSGEA
jgi:membrane-associated protein